MQELGWIDPNDLKEFGPQKEYAIGSVKWDSASFDGINSMVAPGGATVIARSGHSAGYSSASYALIENFGRGPSATSSFGLSLL